VWDPGVPAALEFVQLEKKRGARAEKNRTPGKKLLPDEIESPKRLREKERERESVPKKKD